jgi:hypothetical protein
MIDENGSCGCSPLKWRRHGLIDTRPAARHLEPVPGQYGQTQTYSPQEGAAPRSAGPAGEVMVPKRTASTPNQC